jgi:uncharacterized protein YndB with AHSA1/START domain
MTHAFTAAREIDRLPDEVWRRLTDWERAAAWLGVDALTADGPTAVGTRLRFTTRGKEATSEIVALDPGTSITLRSVQGGVTADYAYRVEADPRGSRVSLVADVQTRGAWTLLAPVIRAAIRRSDSVQLERLDEALAAH